LEGDFKARQGNIAYYHKNQHFCNVLARLSLFIIFFRIYDLPSILPVSPKYLFGLNLYQLSFLSAKGSLTGS
jgi:hypothetical protein